MVADDKNHTQFSLFVGYSATTEQPIHLGIKAFDNLNTQTELTPWVHIGVTQKLSHAQDTKDPLIAAEDNDWKRSMDLIWITSKKMSWVDSNALF